MFYVAITIPKIRSLKPLIAAIQIICFFKSVIKVPQVVGKSVFVLKKAPNVTVVCYQFIF